MGFLEIFFTGVGLSMDAFSVAVCKGLQMRRIRWGQTLTVAAFFGGFQALMPLIGWLLGTRFKDYIVAFDHWIAFGLLWFIGGKMILDVIKEAREEGCGCPDGDTAAANGSKLDLRELTLMALATSIDALAVGITMAFLQVNIWSAILTIGVTTFLLSIVGVFIGNIFGTRYQRKATLAGGIVLLIIGAKILIEHLLA
ncbi:MAG: manganese efflux pump [Clostridia bacterium]|nr:manganese efflux pump [Clostridia bacterium]